MDELNKTNPTETKPGPVNTPSFNPEAGRTLFPHDEIREQQDVLLDAVYETVHEAGELVVHAPTGLGKTAGALAPAIKYALDNDKTVVFLTSRHTQHQIALDTVAKIKQKHNIKIPVVDLVGKMHYCLQPGVERLRGKEFQEYCKTLKADKQCDYYENLKNGDELTPSTKLALTELEHETHTSTQIKTCSKSHNVCPYEVAILLAKKAKVIVTDYNYILNPRIAQSFLQKIGKEMQEIIVIVDEAHNVPGRVKESASDKLSSFILQRAASEADKFGHNEVQEQMRKMSELLTRLALTMDEHMEERYIEKEEVVRRINELHPYPDVIAYIEQLETIGDGIREDQQFSYIGGVAEFLRTWVEGEDEGFTRILEEKTFRDETSITLHYKCLDPSVVTAAPLNNAHASIMMSGTLNPTRMYKELFGVLKAKELMLKSPFAQKNRLALIVPRTSTKYTMRSDGMYADIAKHCAKMCTVIPGNCAIFFPSYALQENVLKHLNPLLDKTLFTEKPGMSKEEKHDFLERFKKYNKTGAVLSGAISGSFGEGIDLPGDLLNGVIVVGLALGKPDLETNALIRYFDNKFGRGWDYGYTFPAFNKTLQSAGRCIRTHTDRGAIIFLDERYDQQQYRRCFPEDWDIKTTLLYEKQIREFFGVSEHVGKKSLADW